MKIIFLEKDFNKLKEAIKFDGRERFAFVLCNLDASGNKLLVYEIIIPNEKDYISRGPGHYEIRKEFTIGVYLKAIEKQYHVIIVHSHPPGIKGFSSIDRRTEYEFVRELFNKIEGMMYASMVFNFDLKHIDSWHYSIEKDDFIRTDKINVIKEKGMEFYFPEDDLKEISGRENRNYMAFGENIRTFRKLDCAIIGLSGTGSITSEHIARLNARKLILCDFDRIEIHNLNRLQGASGNDVGKLKVEFYKEYLNKINPNIEIMTIAKNFYETNIQEIISSADVVFGCVDSGARLSINNLAMSNLIPYFDLGTGIEIENNQINFVGSQIYNVVPGNFVCLNCGTKLINLFDEFTDKNIREENIKNGYINAPIKNPNVYFLNSITSGMAEWEFLKYVLDMNDKYYFKIYYDGIKYRLNQSSIKREGCLICRDYLGKGNKAPLLVPQDYLEKYGKEIPDVEENIAMNSEKELRVN